MRRPAVACGLLFALVVNLGRAEEVAVPLVFDKIEGGDASSGWLQCTARYVQQGTEPIWIEAEQATKLVFQPQAFENEDKAFLGEDAKAGEGRYIAFVARALYEFEIAAAGTYQVWYRAYFPWQGHWNHREHIVGDVEETQVVDCDAGPGDIAFWRWVKGPQYTLKTGRQVWELSYHAGARLDRMVFTADLNWKPAGDEIGAPATVAAPKQCIAIAKSIKPKKVAAWLRLDYAANPGGGKILVEASADGGASFVPVEKGDLSKFSAKGDGSDSLAVRFTLAPGPRGLSPVVESARIVYRSGAAPPSPDLTKLSAHVVCRPARIPLVPMRGFAIRTSTAKQGDRLVTVSHGAEQYQPDAQGRFYLEAESATFLHAYPSNDAAAPIEGAVGKALYIVPVRPHQAAYDLLVPADTKYAVYARIRQGRADTKPKPTAGLALRLDEETDVGGSVPTSDLRPGEWVWARCSTTFDARAGAHRLEWLGGPADFWVDRLCLAPAGAPPPEGQGGTAAVAKPSVSAAVEFFPAFPPRGSRWAGLDAGGAKKVEVSLDGGKTWTAPPGDLGDGEVRVRVEIEGPATLALRLAPDAALLRLADRNQELFFDAGGSIYGVFSHSRGEWIVPPGTRSPAFSIAYQLAGMARMATLSADDGRLVGLTREGAAAGTADSVTWLTDLMDGAISVQTRVAVAAEDAGRSADEVRLASLSVTVANRSHFDIRRVDFPIVSRATLGGIRTDDTMLFPEAFGGALPNPYHRANYSYWPIVWPGTASMSWLDLSDAQSGLYLAAYHTDMLGIEFDAGGNPDRASVHLGFRKQICIGPGETWTGQYALAAHAGDWHTGADCYREWADSWMQARHPEWIRMCDGYSSGLGGANGRFYSRYITHALPLYRWLNVDYVQQWGMTADGEFCGLTLWMNPRYGTAADVARAHKHMREAGIHNTYYINSQGWFPGFSTLDRVGFISKKWFPKEFAEYPPEFFDRWGLREFGGILTQYGPGVGYTASDKIMCPASKGWHDRFVDGLARRHVSKLYKDDGAYIDQMGCTFPYCYAEDHGHEKQHAAAGRGYVEIARDVLDEARRSNPDAVLGVEGITDVLARYADWGLWVSNPLYKGEVFLYTRPDALLFRGTANGHHAYFPSYEDCIADAFLYNRFDAIQPDPYSLRLLRLRQRVKDWMYRGEFMDALGLATSGGPIDAKWFWLQDDAQKQSIAVINVHNWTGTPGGKVSLAADMIARPEVALVFGDDDRAEVATPVIGRYEAAVGVPVNRCSSIVLMSRRPERGGIRAWAVWPEDAGPNRLQVTLVNPAPAEQTVQLHLANAGELGAAEPSQQLVLPPLSVRSATFALGDRHAYKDVYTARVKVSFPGGKTEARTPVPPIILNGDFELDANGDRVPDAWGSWDIMVEHQFNRYVQDVNLLEQLDGKVSREKPYRGKTCLETPVAFDYMGKQLGPPFQYVKMHYSPVTQQYVFLRPGTRYRLRFAARAEPGTKGWMHVSLATLSVRDNQVGSWDGGWKVFEREFETPPGSPVMQLLSLATDTDRPMYFDAVSITELPSGK